jgi:hypothetical protein
MMKRAGLFMTLICSLAQLSVSAQKLSGTVLDRKNNQPLPGASIYINNTTIGTISDSKGSFNLNGIPAGQIDLVISSIGYKTDVIGFSIARDSVITVRLDLNSELLSGVVIRPYEKNGWDHWGFLFINLFIGTSDFGHKCTIVNTKDIHFYYSNAESILMADNIKPIIIVNKALGYRIEYDLQNFSYDEKNRMLVIVGYPFFIEMQGSKKQVEKWQKNRNISYEGSLLHFIRSLYLDSSEQQGFIVRIIKTMESTERARVDAIKQINSNFSGFPQDSIRYFNKVLHEKVISLLDQNPTNPSKFVHRNDNGSASFLFKDNLFIYYPPGKVAPEYIDITHNKDGSDSCITGIMHLDKYEPVTIFPAGNYSDPTNLIISGYWSWREKMATLLPLDFIPDNRIKIKK